MDALLCMVAYGAYVAQREYNGHNIIFRAFSPNVAIAQIFSPLIIVLFMLFGGFYVNTVSSINKIIII